MLCIFRKFSLLLENKSKFVSLRKILPILSLIVFTTFSANSQDSRLPHADGQEKVRVYPNPAQSYITIDLQNSYQKGMNIVVYSFLGKKMWESQNVQEKTTLQVTDYNRGIY